MCACEPRVRTPNCGKMSCIAAAAKRERMRIAAWLRREAAYARTVKDCPPVDRDTVADSIASWIESGEWEKRPGPRAGHAESKTGGTP